MNLVIPGPHLPVHDDDVSQSELMLNYTLICFANTLNCNWTVIGHDADEIMQKKLVFKPGFCVFYWRCGARRPVQPLRLEPAAFIQTDRTMSTPYSVPGQATHCTMNSEEPPTRLAPSLIITASSSSSNDLHAHKWRLQPKHGRYGIGGCDHAYGDGECVFRHNMDKFWLLFFGPCFAMKQYGHISERFGCRNAVVRLYLCWYTGLKVSLSLSKWCGKLSQLLPFLGVRIDTAESLLWHKVAA